MNSLHSLRRRALHFSFVADAERCRAAAPEVHPFITLTMTRPVAKGGIKVRCTSKTSWIV